MGDVRVAVYLSLRLRRDFRVQHSYCFSLYSSAYVQLFSPRCGAFVLVPWYYRFRVVPRLAHKHRACVETQCGWSSSVNDLCPSRRLELMGAGGQLGSMAAWEHSDGISRGGYSASPNWP
jgi:hypothetical protein